MINRKSVYTFIFGGFGIFGLIILLAGMRQGWFSSTESYLIHFETGEGVVVGTPVSISGLKAGSVTSVELNSHNKVVVKIKIQSKFAEHIREDSKAILGRPFIIGEKAISLTPGLKDKKILPCDSVIIGEESLELTDLLSGGRLTPYFATFSKLLEQMRLVIDGGGGPNAVTLVDVYTQTFKALKSVEALGKDIGSIRKDFIMAAETQKLMHDLAASSAHISPLLVETQKTLPAVTQLTTQLTGLMPQLTKTLTETTFTLQALQRSFVLSGGVKTLKREQEESATRSPAGTFDPANPPPSRP
jgi:ABC-type transporter Mla subunit MlaD